MMRQVQTPQGRGPRLLAFQVDGSAVAGGTNTTDGLLEGKFQGTITENSAGNYTITFARPFGRVPTVVFGPFTDVTTMRIVAVTAASVQVEQVGADQTTPEEDADFHMLVYGFDSSDGEFAPA